MSILHTFHFQPQQFDAFVLSGKVGIKAHHYETFETTIGLLEDLTQNLLAQYEYHPHL